MTNTVYDRDADEQPIHHTPATDDELRHLTGINPEQETAHDREAHRGAAEDIAKRAGLFNPAGDTAPAPRAAALGGAGLGAAEAATGLFNPAGAVAGRGLKGIFLGSRRRKQATVGGSIVGLIVGGGFFGLTIASGPLEIIHFAQVLQRIHLTTNANEGNDRTAKVFWSVRNYKNQTVYRTNLGVLGNRYADRIEAKLNAAGYESVYEPRTGAWKGLVPDRNSPEYKGLKNDTEFQAAVKENLGIELKKGPLPGYTGDQFYIDPRDTGYIKGVKNSRGVVSDILAKTGENNISSTIGARVIGKRYGLTFHPIKRLDAKLIAAANKALQDAKAKKEDQAAQDKAAADAEQAAYEDEQAQLLSQGDTTALEAQKSPTKDPNATTQQNAATDSNATGAQGEADTVTQDAAAAGSNPGSAEAGALSKLTGSVGFKITAGGAALIGVACLAKGLDDSATQVKEVQVIEPLMRMSGQFLSLGSQLQSGQDVDAKQVSYFAAKLNDPQTQTSFGQAQSLQAEMGNPYDKSKVSTTLTTIGDNATPFHFLNEGVIGTTLGGACSTAGTIGLTVVSFLGGPVSATVGTALGLAFGPAIIKQAAEWFAGKAVNINLAGAPLGDAANYGTKLVANAGAISNGGAKLSGSQVAELQGDQKIGYQNQIASESFAERTFSPVNSSSLVASLIDKFAALQAGGVANFFAMVFSPSTYTHLFASVFSKHTSAATLSESYDYGLPTYGFSAADMDNANTSDPFANANKAADILDGQDGQTYIDRAQKCFGATITKDSTGTWNVSVDSTPASKVNYYGTVYKNIAGDCADNSLPWLRIRFLIFDTQTMKSVACYEGDEDSCSQVGFGSPTSNTVASPTGTDTGTTGSGAGLSVVLDPGHSPTIDQSSVDPTTGLYNFDYENDPEMDNVYNAALKIKSELESKGVKVTMTKSSATEKINLTDRANRINASKANLVFTIHSSPNHTGEWLGYPDSNSVRTTAVNGGKGTRIDGTSGLVHPEIIPLSTQYAQTMAPIIAGSIGDNAYVAKSFYTIYGDNGLLGNGKNYGNTPVQDILQSIPSVYSEADPSEVTSQAYADGVTKAILTALQSKVSAP